MASEWPVTRLAAASDYKYIARFFLYSTLCEVCPTVHTVLRLVYKKREEDEKLHHSYIQTENRSAPEAERRRYVSPTFPSPRVGYGNPEIISRFDPFCGGE